MLIKKIMQESGPMAAIVIICGILTIMLVCDMFAVLALGYSFESLNNTPFGSFQGVLNKVLGSGLVVCGILLLLKDIKEYINDYCKSNNEPSK